MTEIDISHYLILFDNFRVAVWYDIDYNLEQGLFDSYLHSQEIRASSYHDAVRYAKNISKSRLDLGLDAGTLRIIAVCKDGNHYAVAKTDPV